MTPKKQHSRLSSGLYMYTHACEYVYTWRIQPLTKNFHYACKAANLSERIGGQPFIVYITLASSGASTKTVTYFWFSVVIVGCLFVCFRYWGLNLELSCVLGSIVPLSYTPSTDPLHTHTPLCWEFHQVSCVGLELAL